MRYLRHAGTSARLTGVDAVSQGIGVLRSQARAGISLLEVMFSIGVVMIGLVGIAALLPVAGAQARKGAVADAAARRGADAVREFHVRGMANPNTWRWFDPSGSSGADFYPVTPDQLTAGLSFCIDPRFVAQGAISLDHPARNWFPQGAILTMRRITLSPSPFAAQNMFMGKLQADQVFTSDDDLIFDLPSDRTKGPLQVFSVRPAAPFPPLKRSLNGYISWMATVVPRLDLMGNLTHEYTLSIVVFSRRIIDSPPTFVLASQFSGGELVLNNDLQLRSGDWVMLSAKASQTIDVHKWYRVANAGEFDASTNVLFVTLVGPDWDWLAPQVTVVRGAVAVFEKTIRLETSSLWTY